MNYLFQAIGLYFMPILAFIFMYSFISVIANKEHNHGQKIVSSICFALISWTVTGLMMILN
jgi:hypothetical protein